MTWVPGASESEVSAGPLQAGIVCAYLPFTFFKFFFFDVDHFEIFIEFVTILPLFYLFIFWPWGVHRISALRPGVRPAASPLEGEV